MRIKPILIICLISYLIISGCAASQDCIDNLDKIPMYGHGYLKECAAQKDADNRFLAAYDKAHKSRKEVAIHFVKRGWEFLYAKKLDTSMMRFNEAWLLDSLNADVYWGFGNLLGMQGKFKESIPFFEKSTRINPGNAKVWHDAATSYSNIFLASKDVKYLNSTVYSLKKAISLDHNNPQFYAELTATYTYYMQKDSAIKYLKITDQFDPKAINPEVRKMLTDR